MHPKYCHYCVFWAQAERQERERQKRMQEAREAQCSMLMRQHIAEALARSEMQNGKVCITFLTLA